MLMSTVLGLMSLTQVASGNIDNFSIFVLMRVIHGAISSVVSPVSFSIVADYFPPERRTFANSLISSASYVGIAFSSLTILIISQFGWRMSYLLMGGVGVATAILSLSLIKDKKINKADFGE